MDPFETSNHSFIVKIWLEESAEAGHSARWRGHITHVPSGERRYLISLSDILVFIRPYLEEMGVKSNLFEQVWRWLRTCTASNSSRNGPKRQA